MYQYFEVLIIITIIIFQIIIARDLYFKIRAYKAIFDFEDLPTITQKKVSKNVFKSGDVYEILTFEGEEGVVNITYLQYNNKSRVLATMVKYINVYLIKNKGATIDFHLIKDIVDKHTETSQNEIENRIPAPLYLGLAATMLGIIIGLFSVNFNANSNALNAIQPLINGVKWAMSASVIGLIITTIFSIKIYKDAQVEVDQEKSEFLSKLQSELMPKMATGKLPEVAILSDKLDVFARSTAGSISSLDNIVRTTSNTIEREQQLIQDIRRLDVSKITSANVKIFTKLDDMMGSFANFANYYNELNSSMKGTSDLVNKLQHFVSTTDNINAVLEGIKNNIEESNSATTFFNNHIQSFSRYGDAVNEAVVNADSRMSKAISELGKLAEEQFNSFNEAIANFDSKLSTAFTHSIEKFTEAMEVQILRTEEAFEKSRPKFEKLNKLDQLDKLVQLDSINTRLESLETNLIAVFNKNGQEIISQLKNGEQNYNHISIPKETISSSEPNKEKVVNKSTLEKLLPVVKVATYVVIIIFGVFSLLRYLDFIN
jgi:biopolymer transport protein ExbB/TolQ